MIHTCLALFYFLFYLYDDFNPFKIINKNIRFKFKSKERSRFFLNVFKL